MTMTMTVSHETLAERLNDAYRGGAVPPMRDGLEPTDAEGAYAVQQINTRRWLANGRRIIGRKIGLTAESVRQQFGVDEPDYGVLFDDMLIADGGELDPATVLQPKVEAEVALILSRDLMDPEATPETVAAATECAVAAIEIVDSRITDWKITFADTVADNGSAAFFVLGSERKPLAGLDLRTCGMALDINGKVASLGAGVACMGGPLNGAAWLVRTLSRMGEGLKAGDALMTGALGPMAAVAPGDYVEATIGGLGTVSFTYQS